MLVEILVVLVEILFLFVVTWALSAPAVTFTPSINNLLPSILIGILFPSASSAYNGCTFVPSESVFSSFVVIKEFLPIWISPFSFWVIRGFPSIFKPSEVISISFPSVPIWIEPSVFLVITAPPSIFNPSSTISISFSSDPIWIDPSSFSFIIVEKHSLFRAVSTLLPVILPSRQSYSSFKIPPFTGLEGAFSSFVKVMLGRSWNTHLVPTGSLSANTFLGKVALLISPISGKKVKKSFFIWIIQQLIKKLIY